MDLFDTSMFTGLAGEGTDGLLAHLENNLTLLGDEGAAFVVGCRTALEMGTALTEKNQQELRRLAGTLIQTGHDVLGGIAEPPLSAAKVFHDLGNAVHTLQAHEKKFANAMYAKHQKQEKLTASEWSKLLKIYNDKGF
jgi:hypothetical protein